MPAHDATLPDIACRIVDLEFRDRARVAELLDHIAAFDDRCGARRWGHATTTDWLASECAMDKRTAREYVRVAKRLRCWRKVAEAFALRQLSYSQVRAITRAEETEDETELLGIARGRTVRQIEHHVRQLPSSRSTELDSANQGRAKRHVTYFYDEIGSLHFFGRLPADQGTAFVEALEAAAEELAGPAIPSELARRLTCDCSISFNDLNHGRAQRLVTARQRTALELRDGRVCAFPGCDRTHGLQSHHLTHWTHDGRTDLDNLALLCTAHHHLLHEDRFTARRRRDGSLAFADPHGHEIHSLPSRTSPHLAATT